jgi:uncharacterized repeat protein (TIGR03806 family)
VLFLALSSLPACGGDDGGTRPPEPKVHPTPAPPDSPWKTLSEWGLFENIEQHTPADGVVPFEVISVLFADNADKARLLYVPEGLKIGWKDTDRWDLPLGTILVKTFGYAKDARDPSLGQQAIETRLLVHEPAGWVAHIYVYGSSKSEATLLRAGETVPIDHIDATGAQVHDDYNVPNEFDCQSCHGKKPDMLPLGPRTRQLDRDHDYGKGPENQIDHLAALGLFDQAPPATRVHLTDPYGNGPIVERARSYLDGNCAHCHTEGGKSESTGYWINYERTDPATGLPSNWGVCKFPTSAGSASGNFTFDVVPGDPDHSILVHRVESIDPEVKMPPLLTRRSDARGVQLLRDWIAAMPPDGCK